MHLDQERLQRLLDGEPARGAREHVTACAECLGRFETTEREQSEVETLLRTLDAPPPAFGVRDIAAQARRPSFPRWAAAAAVLVATIGVALAAPGSPVKAWVGAILERMAGQAPAPHVSPAPEPGPAGVAVAPGTSLVIRFLSAQSAGSARVTITEGGEVVVRARQGAAAFTLESGAIVVHNEGTTADFAIRIPRDAPHVEIRLRETKIFLKEGAEIRTSAPQDSLGAYLVSLGAVAK